MMDNHNKLLGLMAVLCMLIGLTGCAERKLTDAVRAANLQCPVSLGAAGRLAQVFYDGESVGFAYEVNEDFFIIDALRRDPSSGKHDIQMILSAPTPMQQQLMELAVDAGVPFKFVYIGLTTRKKAEVPLTLDELKQCLTTSRQSPQRKLQTIMSLTNEQMPIDAGHGVTIERAEVTDNNVLYTYLIDSPYADIDQLADHVDEAKESVRRQVHDMGEHDPAYKAMITILISANMGMGYRYTKNDTDKFVDVILSCDELKGLMHMGTEEAHEHDGHDH